MSGETGAESQVRLAVLSRDLTVRLLNCSASGCLLETNEAVAEGTIGELRLRFRGIEVKDLIKIVRSQHIQGAGGTHHVGAEFVVTSPARPGSVRHIVREQMEALKSIPDPV